MIHPIPFKNVWSLTIISDRYRQDVNPIHYNRSIFYRSITHYLNNYMIIRNFLCRDGRERYFL